MTGLGEFERIARFFAPLVEGQDDALGLVDDAAVVTPPPGKRLVVTADALVGDVHFLSDDPPDRVARKALRVNISDLAAMGAEPYGYTLTMALPRDLADAEAWIGKFTGGQRQDHEEFGIRLLGGDSVSTPGPLTLSVTAFGWAPADHLLTRGGAGIGDDIYVSGTIGDGGLGLAVLQGKFPVLAPEHRTFLADRYHVPQPRPVLGQAIVALASAGLDVSDGLVQDLGHITEVSKCGAEIELAAVPVSEAAKTLLAGEAVNRTDLIAAGDDYELLFTAPPGLRGEIETAAAQAGTPVTRIGTITSGEGVTVTAPSGERVELTRRGYTHA